jgi:NhaP-type Na+/H+ and K+/H+ antiporter
VPEFSQVVFEHRNFVIGFIHLMMLGVISGFLFSFLLKQNLVNSSRSFHLGMYSFLLGFVLTEMLLLIQGVKFYFGSGILSNYYLLLFISSILLPIGIALFLFNIIIHKNNET